MLFDKPSLILRIDKVVGQFEVWLDGPFPFAKLKVKILERESGDFLAVPNVIVRDVGSKKPVHVSGLGDSIEEAFGDLMSRFLKDLHANLPDEGFSESNFEWSAPEEF